MIQVYSPHNSNRLEYTCNVLFRHVLLCNYEIVSDKNLLNYNYPIVNYSLELIPNSIQIVPSGILFEEDIVAQEIEVNDGFYFYKTSDNSTFKYDLLASTFYLISRYEEYLPSERDEHNRFKAKNSIAFKNGFLDKAVVNRWALDIKKSICILYPKFVFPTQSYKYISSHDIDLAYAYKYKSIKRLLGGGVKSLIKEDFEDLKYRIKYVFGLTKDPFDTYNQMFEIIKKNKVESIFFIQVGKNGAFDKNHSINSNGFVKLINRIANFSDIGIHPSYASNLNIEVLKNEVENLALIYRNKITKSRQHYLKLEFPNTYKDLISVGITDDYTMGYASELGFRAGICTTYPFFDLIEGTETSLMIHPFQVMDGTLNQYLKLSPNTAFSRVIDLHEEVKKVKGTFITLFHNDSLSNMRHWKGWKNIFEEVVNKVN